MKRVYILGDVRGYYRIQNIIKYFIDRPKEYRLSFNNYWSYCRPFKYIVSLLFNTIHIIFSDVIYVCILNVDIDIIWELIIAKLFRKKIIVDYYISIYEKVVTDEHWFKEKSFLAKLAIGLDRFYLKVGTNVGFLTDEARKRYCELAKISEDEIKTFVLPWVIEQQKIINYKEHSIFNVCWWGSYLPLHGLEKIIEAAKVLKLESDEIHFYFFGNNDEKGKKYVELAKSLGVDDICTFENSFTMKNGKLLDFLEKKCDLVLGNFGDSVKARNLMSNKVIEGCTMQLPVLTENSVEYYCFFSGQNDIYLCNPDKEDIAKKIMHIKNLNYSERKKNIDNAYQIYQNNFSIEIFNERMNRVMNEVLN